MKLSTTRITQHRIMLLKQIIYCYCTLWVFLNLLKIDPTLNQQFHRERYNLNPPFTLSSLLLHQLLNIRTSKVVKILQKRFLIHLVKKVAEKSLLSVFILALNKNTHERRNFSWLLLGFFLPINKL